MALFSGPSVANPSAFPGCASCAVPVLESGAASRGEHFGHTGPSVRIYADMHDRDGARLAKLGPNAVIIVSQLAADGWHHRWLSAQPTTASPACLDQWDQRVGV